MRRVRNWDVALVNWSRRVVGEPFVLGETDCAWLCWTALHVIYGGRDFCGCGKMPRYSTERERLRAHRETGGIETRVLDVAEDIVDHAYARSGDLVTGFDPDARLGSVGIIVNADLVSSNREQGVFRAPIGEVAHGTVWRVP